MGEALAHGAFFYRSLQDERFATSRFGVVVLVFDVAHEPFYLNAQD
jgi:hypothetical protein